MYLPTFRKFHSVLIGALLTIALVSASGANPPHLIPSPVTYSFSHLAGSLGGWGNANGIGPAARFYFPHGLTVDGSGNLYVADSDSHTIRKVTPNGVVTTIAGLPGASGTADGTGTTVRFNLPKSVAIDSTGNLYVADENNHTIRLINPSGVVSTYAGTAGVAGSADGTGTAAQFNFPIDLTIDSAGSLYVADNSNNTIRKIALGGVVTTLAGSAGIAGSTDGNGTNARFYGPNGVTVDGAGNLYVADNGNQIIRKITPGGDVTMLAGTAGVTGSTDGNGSVARFNGPTRLAVDSTGNLYVADANNFTIRKITPSGTVTTFAGIAGVFGSTDGSGSTAMFHYPEGIALDSSGNAYVSDSNNQTIRKITAAGTVTTLAGTAWQYGHVDGTGAVAEFLGTEDVAVDGTGIVYVSDYGNHTIRKITPGGVVTTIAGTVGVAGTLDGTGVAAQFNHPAGVAIDSNGIVYVADSGNHTIRQITPNGAVTTLAGTAGVAGTSDGTGTAAQFNNPVRITVDPAGILYVADYNNHTIRMISPGGVVTTLAGTAGVAGSADGSGTAALFNHPRGIAVDRSGTVYVGDQFNQTIRKISPGGIVTTIAGSVGVAGLGDGVGTAAQFFYPNCVTVDQTGNLYVGTQDLTIRMITPAGSVTTLAGVPGVRGSLDGLGSVAQFNNPDGIAVGTNGNLYLADYYNNTVRLGQPAGPPTISTQPQSQSITSGGSVQFSVSAASILALTYQWNLNGSAVSGATNSTLNLTSVSTSNAGDYTVVVSNSIGSVTSNKATLTVGAAPVTPPPSGDSGGGGGGGAPSLWFVGALSLLVGGRRLMQRRT